MIESLLTEEATEQKGNVTYDDARRVSNVDLEDVAVHKVRVQKKRRIEPDIAGLIGAGGYKMYTLDPVTVGNYIAVHGKLYLVKEVAEMRTERVHHYEVDLELVEL